MMAGEALIAATREALAAVAELNGCYEGRPLQAAVPYATVEADVERDWSHKSGSGREVRLTIVLHDGGERPTRLRTLSEAAQAALGPVGGGAGGWRIVSFVFVRSRLVAESERRWACAIEYRARMLAD